MKRYNVTLYAAVNRYKLREAQDFYYDDYSDVQQTIDNLPTMKDICTMEVFEHRIDEDGDGCYELIATIDNPNYVYYPTIRDQEGEQCKQP